MDDAEHDDKIQLYPPDLAPPLEIRFDIEAHWNGLK